MTNTTNISPGSFFTSSSTSTVSTGWNDLQSVNYADWATISTPQPAQATTQAGWTEKHGSYYFEDDPDCIHRFHEHRTVRKSMNVQAGVTPVWTEALELNLVEKVWRHYHDHPWPGIPTWTHPELDLDKLETQSLRKYPLPPFKIEYQTYQEIRLRLYNTVISIKGNPFWVKQISNSPAGWRLAVWDGLEVYQVLYKDLQDLRSMPPMYINVGHPGWLTRHPGRVYQQGMNRSNTSIRTIEGNSGLLNFDPSAFIHGFRNRRKQTWSKEIFSLMKHGDLSSIRLSDQVAVTAKKDGVLACYKGRALGRIQDNEVVVLDEDDLLQEWIEKATKDVGLELRG